MPELQPLENTRLQDALPNSPALRTLLALLAGLVIEEEELGELHAECAADLVQEGDAPPLTPPGDHARRVQDLRAAQARAELVEPEDLAAPEKARRAGFSDQNTLKCTRKGLNRPLLDTLAQTNLPSQHN